MGRTIVKMAEKHQKNQELKVDIHKGFSPMLGTPSAHMNSLEYYKEGEELATVFAEDFDGIRRSWTVTVGETSGAMQRIYGQGKWTLIYASHQTAAEKTAQRKWLDSFD